MKYKLVIIIEGELEEVMEFSMDCLREGFSEGLSYGGEKYGAGNCAGYQWPEEKDELEEEYPDLMKTILNAVKDGDK